MRRHIALVMWWGPELDTDEGGCLTELRIGDVEFEYNERQNNSADIFRDSMLQDGNRREGKWKG